MRSESRTRRVFIVAAAIVLGIALGSPAAFSQSQGNPNPRIFPPESYPYGMSYGAWSAEQWKTVLAGPYDPTACTMGGTNQVLYLATEFGIGAGEVGHRTFNCTVPRGKALFFPLLGAIMMCPWDCDPGGSTTIEELRQRAKEGVDLTTVLEAEVDGVAVEGLRDYRFTSPVFFGNASPEGPFGFYGLAGPYGPAVVDGYWIMIAPLSTGVHVVRYHAVVGDPQAPLFETEVIQNLTVAP